MPDPSNVAASPDHAGNAELLALGYEFRGASDAKLRKVTRLIDSMPQRGAADALLQPVRERLATLRPVRSMNRNRLLFTPFDRLLVPPARWRPGTPTLPRSIVTPVITLLDSPGGPALPVAPPFDADDETELSRHGRPLWAAAATVLERADIPTDWNNLAWQPGRSLPIADLEDLLPMMAMVFRSAHALRNLPPPGDPASDRAVLTLLETAAETGPLGWGAMLTLLIGKMPADHVTRIAATFARGHPRAALLRAGIDHAVTRTLGQLEQEAQFLEQGPIAVDPSTLLRRLEVMRRVFDLNQIENRPGFEQKRAARLQDVVSSGSRELFQQSLHDRLGQLERAISTETGDPGAIVAIEADARRLHSFAIGAAALDGRRDYQTMIESAMAPFVGALDTRTAVARLRMVELLCGSERAVQLAAACSLTPRSGS